MTEKEHTKEMHPASSATVADIYSLVHSILEGQGEEDDGHSRDASWSIVDQGGYKGYVAVEAVNPFSELNEIGLCGIVRIGELDKSRQVNFQDSSELGELGSVDHLTKSYYIYHTGSRLNIGVSSKLIKPKEINSLEESEELLKGDSDLGQMLAIVYVDEAKELISRLHSVQTDQQR